MTVRRTALWPRCMPRSVTDRPACHPMNSSIVVHGQAKPPAGSSPSGSPGGPAMPSRGTSWAAYSGRWSATTGAGDRPSTPQMRLVTPARTAISQLMGIPCSPMRVPARAPWLWVSTKPGASTRPSASMT